MTFNYSNMQYHGTFNCYKWYMYFITKQINQFKVFSLILQNDILHYNKQIRKSGKAILPPKQMANIKEMSEVIKNEN